jgi:hypothetical protein
MIVLGLPSSIAGSDAVSEADAREARALISSPHQRIAAATAAPSRLAHWNDACLVTRPR